MDSSSASYGPKVTLECSFNKSFLNLRYMRHANNSSDESNTKGDINGMSDSTEREDELNTIGTSYVFHFKYHK